MSLFPVAILAGGLGTRLGDLTKDKPKCLVDVNGKPFIIRQLELLQSQGITRVVVCTGWQGTNVIHAVQDWQVVGRMDYLRYADDGADQLGTAGAIRKALPLLGDEFFVLYGDSYLECDYGAVQEAYTGFGRPMGMMTVCDAALNDRPNTTIAYGRVKWHHKTMVDEQSRHLDYGLGVFNAAAFRQDEEPDLSVLYQNLAARHQLRACQVDQRFHEIGSLEGLERLREHLGKGGGVGHTAEYLRETIEICQKLDQTKIERMVDLLVQLRERKGRLFILGVGGSAANASHAVNDARKIANIEAYAPTDNVAELTARTNDWGWSTVFNEWLQTSHLSENDMILVFSVGGGTDDTSKNIKRALEYACNTTIIGIVGRESGYTAQVATECLVIPEVNPNHVTPHAEEMQMVVWHLMMSHPRLKP